MGLFGKLMSSVTGGKGSGGSSLMKELQEIGFDVPEANVMAVLEKIKAGHRQKGITCMVSDFELIVSVLAAREIPEPYESYAQEVAEYFSRELNTATWEDDLRPIGRKIDDNHLQILVARRAEVLCKKAYESGNKASGEFSIRYLEHAWAGFGGWLP